MKFELFCTTWTKIERILGIQNLPRTSLNLCGYNFNPFSSFFFFLKFVWKMFRAPCRDIDSSELIIAFVNTCFAATARMHYLHSYPAIECLTLFKTALASRLFTFAAGGGAIYHHGVFWYQRWKNRKLTIMNSTKKILWLLVCDKLIQLNFKLFWVIYA